MQYILLTASNTPAYLADCKELTAITEGVIDHANVDESPLTYRLMYGAYKPQPRSNYTHEEVTAHIAATIGQPLIHIDGKRVVNLSIDAMVISESVIKRQCSKLESPIETRNVAFAALVKAPEYFEVDDKHYQTSTAYLRLGDADAISTLRNRKGLFAFTSEGKRERPEDPLTEKNWHHHIDHLRMIKEARRAQ